MKKYESYKDSGVEWIGEIPRGWEKTKHKFQIDVLSGYPFKSELFDPIEGFPIIRIRDITSGKIETFYTGDIIEDFIVKKGDLLVGMDGDFNIRWWDSEEGLLNQRCCSIKEGKGVLRRYLFYILPFQLQIINDLTYFTTVKHLSVSDIKNTPTVLPPLSEQSQIVSYLDEKTSLIDSLIEKTKRKIELLKEERTSLINHTVTKGLNPNVEMKDSGVEWIGEIPRGWGKNFLKNSLLQKPDNGLFKKKEEFGSGLEFINVSDLFNYNSIIKIDSLKKVEVSEKEYENSRVINGDIFFVRSSLKLEGIGVSSIYLEDKEIVYDCHIIRIRPNQKKLIPKFLIYQLNSISFRDYLISVSQTVTMTTISQDKIKDLILVFPPLSEQEEIVSFLDEKTSTIDKTIELEGKRIDYLKEYRQSLISEVVTGKIKVITDE